MILRYPNINFTDQPDNRVDRRLHKISLINDKKIFAYYQPKERNNITIKKLDQQDLEEVHSFCIEEGQGACDEWCINAQIRYCKG